MQPILAGPGTAIFEEKHGNHIAAQEYRVEARTPAAAATATGAGQVLHVRAAGLLLLRPCHAPVNRPCLGCGVVIPSGSRCADCQRPLNNHHQRGRKGRTSSDWRHRKASLAQRKRVPFCELRESPRCTGKAETLQHILPITLFPEYAHEPANHLSACRSCNSSRGNRYTDAEHDGVLEAIRERKQRHTPLTSRAAANRLPPSRKPNSWDWCTASPGSARVS